MFAFKLTVTYNYFYRISRQQHYYYTTTELGYHTAKTWKASFLVKKIKYWRDTMDFGITFPSYIRAYHDAKLAEDYGFSHAWFYDSQMCYSDVYAAMALAAEHTRYLKIGTLIGENYGQIS